MSKKVKLSGSTSEGTNALLTDTNNVSSIVKFSVTFDANDDTYRMIEIPKQIDINSIIDGKESLSIIGYDDPGSDTVICTSDCTYSIRRVETSNSDITHTIMAQCNNYYELKEIVGRTDKLKDILRPTAYTGKDNEQQLMLNKKNVKFYTRHDIDEIIQASKGEIEKAFQSLNIVNFNGYMRIISKFAVREVVRDVVDTIIEHGMSLDSIDVSILGQYLNETDIILLEVALNKLGVEIVSSSSGNTNGMYKLDADIIAVETAHYIFSKTLNKSWSCDDFISQWSMRVPGMTSDLLSPKLLLGVAVKDAGCYKYLPVDEMPADVVTRFKVLFAATSQYTIDEITPYLINLVSSGSSSVGIINSSSTSTYKSVAEILLQHTKCINGQYYVAK